jgi:hypothetical protein
MIFGMEGRIVGGLLPVAAVMAGCLGLMSLPTPARAAEAPAAEVESTPPHDALVYKNGDRLQGKLISQTAEMIVFQSERFGELHVPAANAVVIKAAPAPATPPASATPPAPAPVAAATPEAEAEVRAEAKTRADRHAEEEQVSVWERFSTWVLTARLRNYFGPWSGRFAFSTELVSDSSRRDNLALEAHLQRKWKSDDVQLNGRYDYSETNGLKTTDTVRGDGSWRHDFTRGRFGLYRPTVEWNRANFKNGVPANYVLLQQEFGAGLNLLDAPARKVRAGISENLFNVWNSGPDASQNARAVESLFEEAELKLPWRMTLTQRGVWYNPFLSGRDGWENTAELAKKLTETLSVSLRHEIRRNNPDGSSQDYTRLKFLLGIDF